MAPEIRRFAAPGGQARHTSHAWRRRVRMRYGGPHPRDFPTRTDMARTDAIVLGAGIVGTSVALHLVKRGLSVALVDRAGVGEQTSYGNSGVIEGSTILPPAFPS